MSKYKVNLVYGEDDVNYILVKILIREIKKYLYNLKYE